jgi:OOP family OmpA-OmpF porin
LGAGSEAGLGSIGEEDAIAAASGIAGAVLGAALCSADEPAPRVDSDGDGVYDDSDTCPGTARGVTVDSRGCPLDSDNDGVLDGQDRCPNTPRGVSVDGSGCPAVGETLLRLRGVNFGLNSADSRGILAEAIRALNDNSNVRVEVQGHTDSSGSESYNMSLSQQRANSVVDHLVKVGGIDGARLQPQGYGEGKPIGPDDTSGSRLRNRRVDLVIIE